MPDHPGIKLPLPGQTPFQYVLPLNRFAFAALVLGDFDGAFSNQEISLADAVGFNRNCAGYFSHFSHIRHLIADDERIEEDLTWAPFDLVHKEAGHMKFKKRPAELENAGGQLALATDSSVPRGRSSSMALLADFVDILPLFARTS